MAAPHNNGGFYARHRVLVWTLGAIAFVILLASSMTRDNPIPVRAANVSRATIRSVISTNGKVEPLQDFEAHAPVGTTVKKLFVKEGDHVKAGQLLLQLDDAEAESQAARALAQVRSAQASLSAVQRGGNREEVLTTESQLAKARTERESAQRNAEAMERLQQQGAAAPGEVKEAQNRLARAEADLELLQQKQKQRYSQPEIASVEAQKQQAQAAYAAAEDVLSQLNIKAPFDGVVYSLPIHQGGYVNPGDMVLEEADLSKVRVRAFVDEPDVGRLSPGQKIETTWDAMPGRVWTGEVPSIPAAVKLHGTRNVGEVTFVVDNGDYKLLPNVNMGVTIVTAEHHNVPTVPREAIRQEGDKIFVYEIANNNTLQRRDLQTAISNLTKVEVTSGIGDRALVALASTNSKPLANGLPVKVIH